MRSREPHPLSPDIVHVRKDRCNRASLARGRSPPCRRFKPLDKNLIHALIGRKHPHRRAAELSVRLGLVKPGFANLGFAKLGLTCGHGSLLLHLVYDGLEYTT